MGKKAPFWIYVEELASEYRDKMSFAEIKQMAAREWPALSDEDRDRYKLLSRQDRVVAPAIRYEPPLPEAKSQQNTSQVPDYAHVLSKFFTLVDIAAETTIVTGGEIALAGFSLREGVSQFLSAHLLPAAATDAVPVRKTLKLPIIQKSSIIVSGASDILTDVSQFCNCEQCSAGKIVLFATREKVGMLRDLFRQMLDQDASNIAVIIEPIEKLIGVIHVALAQLTEHVDLNEVSRVSALILRRSATHARVPCSRHRPTDHACAHGGVSALAFSFIHAFIEDLRELKVNTDRGTHCLQPKSTAKRPEASSEKQPPKLQVLKNETDQTDFIAVIPGPVVYVPGKGRLRTVAQIVPWKKRDVAGDGEAFKQRPENVSEL